MNLTSCSVLLNRPYADPIMALDFAGVANEEGESAHTVVSVYNCHNRNLRCNTYEDIQLSSHDFNYFLDDMAMIAKSIGSTVAARRRSDTIEKCFYGKGWFKEGIVHFRYNCGTTAPPGPLAVPVEPLWNEDWTRCSRDRFSNQVALTFSDISGQENRKEPRLDAEILKEIMEQSKAGSQTKTIKYYRICFCCCPSAATNGESPASYRLLCWLHPVDSQPLIAADLRRRVEVAALNNYLCVCECLPLADVSKWLSSSKRAQLFFVAVEAGNWAVADWLRSGSGGCGVDVLDEWGATELARLCQLGGDPKAVAGLLERGADRRRRDFEGNSALHRLAAALTYFADSETSVLPALEALVGRLSRSELLDWLAEENMAGKKPMALMSNGAALDWILGRLMAEHPGGGGGPGIRHESVRPEVFNLLTCSSGFSVVHSFAAFGQLDSAEQTITKRLGPAAWQRLLGSSIPGSRQHQQQEQDDRQLHNGYSVIHAAFQEGSWRNVKYLRNWSSSCLLRNNQPGWPPPASAVDLAIREGHLCGYEKFQAFVSRAMQQAEVAEALGVLDCVEDCLTFGGVADVADCRVVPAVEFRLQRVSMQIMSNKFQDPLLLALKSAFEHDSADSLCGLIRSRNCKLLRLLAGYQNVELLKRLEGTLMATGNMGETDFDEFLGLLGLALRLGRWRLAGQLLSARQFDLLPASLAVMLRLKRWQHLLRDRPGNAADSADATSGDTQQPFELMNELYNTAKRTFCGAMVRLHMGAVTDFQRNLVLNYLGGRFHGSQEPCAGPLFDAYEGVSAKSIFDMMILTQEPDLLALPCATDYVDRLMSSPKTFCCHTCPGPAGDCHDGAVWADKPLNLLANWWPEEVASLRRVLPRGWTPKSNMALTFVFNMMFVCVLGYCVHKIGSPGKQSELMGLKIFLIVCAFSYSMQELLDFLSNRQSGASGKGSCNKLCNYLRAYFAFKWNMVDLAAVCLLIFGLVAVFVLDQYDGSGNGLWYYFARQILALSFALYCLRMLSTLRYYERLGLYISMIRTTFVADFVPFLLVNVVFLVAFGFLIVSVLFPGGMTYVGGQSIVSHGLNRSSPLSFEDFLTEMFQRPLLAHFGEFGFESLRNCQKKPSETECPHPLGNELYGRLLLFIYLFTVSVLFINVLIAKLSLTVSREDERARVIWRHFRANLLVEFSGVATPPPVLMLRACLAIVWTARWLLRKCRSNCNNSSETASSAENATLSAVEVEISSVETGASINSGMHAAAAPVASSTSSTSCSHWWLPENLAHSPDAYKQFLFLQAMQFRKFRHTFAQYKV